MRTETGIKDIGPGNHEFHRCNECGWGSFYNVTNPAEWAECPYCGHQQPKRTLRRVTSWRP